jgi:competence protein ComEC
MRRRGRSPWPAPTAAAFGFLLWIHLPYAALPDDRLTVTALNVGKGASHVVTFPGGKLMVVDCGSAAQGDAGRRIVAPHLRGLGARRIDVLVLTHPHEDHTGGAAALLEEFPVGEIWVPAEVPLEAFGEAVVKFSGIVKRRSGGETYCAGGASVIVRGAGASGDVRANEKSLFLEVGSGDLCVWLPGDTEKGGASRKDADAKTKRIRVLFLPHHGSPSADPASWVDACRPSAVVSQNRNCFAGKNLLPSFEYFLLENGAFTVRTEGKAVRFDQESRLRIWKLLCRFP